MREFEERIIFFVLEKKIKILFFLKFLFVIMLLVKNMKQKTFYYKTLEDDVCDDRIKDKTIDEKYKYIHRNVFYKFFGGIYYWCFIRPVAFVYAKLIKRVKIKNKKILKQAKKTGYFLFGNHTNNLLDAFVPSFVCGKKPYLIVNPKNLNVPPFKGSTAMLGAVPLPSTIGATRNFVKAVETLTKKKCGIVIYPEAKIWPYFTGIRPFKKGSFKYPVMFDKPAFCLTTTYQKTKNNRCKIIVYVDGPFEVDKSKSQKEQEIELENKIKNAMTQRAKNSNFEKNKFIRIETKEIKND